MVRDRIGHPDEADGPWDARRYPSPDSDRGYEFEPQFYYTPTTGGPRQPIVEDRPGYEFDGPFPVAHRRPRHAPPPRVPVPAPAPEQPSPDQRPRTGRATAKGSPSARSRASAHAEWTRLLRLHRAEPRESPYQRFRANLHFRGWGARVVLPIASMTAVGVAVVVIAGANSGAGTPAPPGTATVLGYPPATLASGFFPAAASSRGITLQLGRVASDGPEVVALGAESGTLVPRAEFFISHNAGTTWSLAAESGPDGGAPLPGHAPRLIAGGPGGWVALGPDSIWTSSTGSAWTLRSETGLPGATVLRRTAAGFLAAGRGAVYLSASGMSWQRLPGPAGSLAIRSAAVTGNRILLVGDVAGTTTGGVWLSTDAGHVWTPVPVPGTGQIGGVAAVPGGFVLNRPVRNGTAIYRSPDGAAWQLAAKVGVAAPGLLAGGPSGAVLAGPRVAFVSADGTSWHRVTLDPAGIAGAAPTPDGAVIATSGAAGPELEAIGVAGSFTRTRMAAVPGALQPQLAVTAVAAHDSEQIAVGSANGFPAVWTSTDGGTNWGRASGSRPTVFRRPGDQQLSSVTYGTQGWLAVGGVSTGATQHPVVIGSADGQLWTAADGEQAFLGQGLVTEQAAAGPDGYVIVGYQTGPGGRSRAAAWWSAGLNTWQRVPDGTVGAMDGVSGERQMLAVTADGTRGFVAVGRQGDSPAIWRTPDGRSWTVSVLQLPPQAARAVLLHVAAVNGTVVAIGMIATPQGALAPYAARSADGGATWTQQLLPVPNGTALVTALAATGGSFTATGSFGTSAGHRDVVIWTSPDGRTWTAAAPVGAGLSGPGIQAITGLTASGSTLTGVGFTASPASEAPLFWQAPIR